MIDNVKGGDLLVVGQGWLGPTHVAILAPVWGELVVYEYTMDDRGLCVRTGRETPKGVQAHEILDFAASAGGAAHYPICRTLYPDEIDRLTETVESCLGRGPVAWGSDDVELKQNHGANVVAHTLQAIGLWTAPPQNWTAKSLVRSLTKAGIVRKGQYVV